MASHAETLAPARNHLRDYVRNLALLGVPLLLVVPFLPIPRYYLHLIVLFFIWGFIYTSWAIMGRFGLVSLGHGAFMGIGAYTVVLLWNYFGVSPWLSMPLGVAGAVLLALVVGIPCFRFRIVGHYFAIATLAVGHVALLVFVALRNYTGGSLGVTPRGAAEGMGFLAFQFPERMHYYLLVVVVWLLGLWVWMLVDRSMSRLALDAIADDEDAAAAVGIDVTREKLRVTVISAGLTAVGGAIYAQYQLYIAPDTVSGIFISLQIVFAVIAGGVLVMLGPTVGAIITLGIAEGLRVMIGIEVIALDTTIYGLLLVLIIIFMPKGILGGLLDLLERWRRR
jgi:branched-chain amino acid transport system permease protein